MKKKVCRLLALISYGVILIIISAQSGKESTIQVDLLPGSLKFRLDSLRKADDLAGWLYSYREYVYEDPAKRISILADAQSSAWRTCRTDTEREEWFNCLAAQGYYFLYKGNILRSIDAYELAYRFYFDKPVPSADVLEYVLKPLGNNYTRLGDYDRAFFIQEKSLLQAEENDSSQIAPICHNLATTAIWKGDLVLAKQYCEKGLKQVQKNTALHGLLLSTLSEVFLKSGEKDSAEINSKTAISILTKNLSRKEEINTAYWLRGAWQGLGDVQKEKNEPAAALGSYEKAAALIDSYYQGRRKREKAQLSVLSGHMLMQLHQLQKAMQQYNDALKLMIPTFQPTDPEELPEPGDLYGENTVLDALHGKANCLYALGIKEKALACYMLLFATEKKLRREFFSITAKQQQQKENRQWAEKALETAYSLWKAGGQKEFADKVLLIAEMSKAQLLIDEMQASLHYSQGQNRDTLLEKQRQLLQAIAFYEKEAAMDAKDSNSIAQKKEQEFKLSLIQKQVRNKYPFWEDPDTMDVLPSSKKILQNIEAGTVVTEFFTGEKNIYVIHAEKNKVTGIRMIENADSVLKKISSFISTYFQQGPANMMNNPGNYYKDAFAVYQTLFKDSEIKGKRNYIVIPDGILGYLPFDALITEPVYKPDAGQWPFMLKKINLHFCYSLQTKLQQGREVHSSKTFAGFFIAFDSSTHSPIPAVRKEQDEIRTVMQGNYFTDQYATIRSFKKQLEEVNLLHISTHSFLQGKENIPVLQLADDKFFLFELYGKAFHPQLVVLSACRTGQGMLARGEGIISLARGFTATGAEGIVAGLWDINDNATATIMSYFYKLLSSGQKPADALHGAKLQWLQQKNTQSFQKLPYYWAGMVYSGDNSPVKINNRRNSSIWLWIAILLLAGGLIFFIKKTRLTLK